MYCKTLSLGRTLLLILPTVEKGLGLCSICFESRSGGASKTQGSLHPRALHGPQNASLIWTHTQLPQPPLFPQQGFCFVLPQFHFTPNVPSPARFELTLRFTACHQETMHPFVWALQAAGLSLRCCCGELTEAGIPRCFQCKYSQDHSVPVLLSSFSTYLGQVMVNECGKDLAEGSHDLLFEEWDWCYTNVHLEIWFRFFHE